MIGAALLLNLSIGLGYNAEYANTHESRDFKGIVQVEHQSGNFSYGFWHSSQIDNGLIRNIDDQNIFYIKRDFKF